MKKKTYKNKLIIVTVAAFLSIAAFPASIILISSNVRSAAFLAIGIVMFMGSSTGAPLLWFYILPKTKRRNALYHKTADSDYINISELASSIGKRKKTVIKDLQALIRMGYFKEHRFDKEFSCLYIPEAVRMQVEDKESINIPSEHMESITCEGCGAVFALFNGTGKCPFCRRFYSKR